MWSETQTFGVSGGKSCKGFICSSGNVVILILISGKK